MGGDFGWLEKAGEPIKKTLVAFAKTVGGNRSIVYRLAGRAVYCPRDVMNFADKVMRSGDPAHYLPENNRADASSNDVIDEFLGVLSSEDADRIEMLAAGGDADIMIHEAVIDGDLTPHESRDFWTQLLHVGYLTVVKPLPLLNTYRVTIANEEIREVFICRVNDRYSKANREFVALGQDFVKAATEGDRDAMAGVWGRFSRTTCRSRIRF